MKELYRFPLSEEAVVAVDVDHMHHIPEWCVHRIDELWAKKEHAVYEAPIVCLARYSPTYLIGEFVDYSAWYACQKDHELRKTLDIHPLAVTGRTMWREKILVGKRASSLPSMRGRMECCPSGSVDRSCILNDGRADLSEAICLELFQEAGIARSCVQSVSMKDLYLSTEDGVFDIHLDVVLNPDCDLSSLAFSRQEYEEMFWVERRMAATKCSQQQWVALSRYLIVEEGR